MSFKYELNALVEDEDGSVGKISSRKEDIDGIAYKVEFLDEDDMDYNENELKRTNKKEITTLDGRSQEQLDAEKCDKQEKEDKREKAQKMCHDIGEVILRYKDKCKDGKTFWQFVNEDIEALVYKEL